MSQFKIGDRVRILPNSEFYLGYPDNPKDMDGTVIRQQSSWWRVRWDNNKENTYREYDLKLSNSKTEKITNMATETQKKFIIGTRDVEVTVRKGEIAAKGKRWDATTLNRVINTISRGGEMNLAGYEIRSANENLRTIRIGCTDENNVFSLKELKTILDAYNSLNK